MQLGAWLDARDGDQNDATPLHIAAWKGKKELINLLISKGSKINSTDNIGQTPLDLALKHDQTENVSLLRKHGGKTSEELKAEQK